MTIDTISEHASFGGKVGFYSHASSVNHCDMRFSVFVPPQAETGPVPVVTYLSGLTCTEETFMIKGGAQRIAAELGVMLIAPDTSPRGDDVPDDPDGAYDFGLGAGFYLNATEAPWNKHYHMYDYLLQELPNVVFNFFPGDRDRQGITGHSMGGHGALTIGLLLVALTILWAVPSYPGLITASLFVGLGFGGVTPLWINLPARSFGAGSVGRALGLMNPLHIPLTAPSAPLAGYISDTTGSYELVWLVYAGFCLLSGLGLFFMQQPKAPAAKISPAG